MFSFAILLKEFLIYFSIGMKTHLLLYFLYGFSSFFFFSVGVSENVFFNLLPVYIRESGLVD